MNNKIVFTQDTAGERNWLNSQFCNFTNLETNSSGKWETNFPKNGNNSQLYEIAYSDSHNLKKLLACGLDRVKSFYSNCPELAIKDNKYWVCANEFTSTATYASFEDKPKFWVMHIARSGTVFVETLLKKFRTAHCHHTGIHPNNEVLLDYWQHAHSHPEVALVLVYRPQLWEVLTSTVLAIQYGYHHSDNFNWNLVKPIELTVKHMLHFESVLIRTLNFWCNLRSLLPSHSFLLLDGSKMISNYSHLVEHNKVNYNKQQLISNYIHAQNQWYDQFDSTATEMLNNAIMHLSAMNCKQNLNHLL